MQRRLRPPWLYAAGLLAAACEPNSVVPHTEPLPTVDVAIASVERRREPAWQTVAGTVRPFDRAVVAARSSGVVTGANFLVGQSVSPHEVLLTLQADELYARLEHARVAYEQAARDSAREAGLFQQGASTDEAARAAEDRLRRAHASLDEARIISGYTRVMAPYAGTITRKHVRTGDFASLGTPLFEIESREHMRVELAVPEALRPLAPGALVRLRFEEVFVEAHVTEISPAVDPLTRTRDVVVEFPGAIGIASGQFIRAQWPAGEAETVTAPAGAIDAIGQIDRAFVVADGKAVLRVLKTGIRDPHRVHIISGLEAGEQVILRPPAGLRDGQPVRVLP